MRHRGYLNHIKHPFRFELTPPLLHILKFDLSLIYYYWWFSESQQRERNILSQFELILPVFVLQLVNTLLPDLTHPLVLSPQLVLELDQGLLEVIDRLNLIYLRPTAEMHPEIILRRVEPPPRDHKLGRCPPEYRADETIVVIDLLEGEVTPGIDLPVLGTTQGTAHLVLGSIQGMVLHGIMTRIPIIHPGVGDIIHLGKFQIFNILLYTCLMVVVNLKNSK